VADETLLKAAESGDCCNRCCACFR